MLVLVLYLHKMCAALVLYWLCTGIILALYWQCVVTMVALCCTYTVLVGYLLGLCSTGSRLALVQVPVRCGR